MICISFLLVLSTTIYAYHEPLLHELANLYIPNAFIDDVNSIAIDINNKNIYTTNTGSGTIDIISYSTNNPSLEIKREIDIRLQSSPHFELDYITSITYSSKGYIIASLIPLNYAQNAGWLVFIDTNTMYIDHFIELKYCYSPKHVTTTNCGSKVLVACEGLEDPDVADPAGSISIIDINPIDPKKWKIYNVGFTDFDDCDDSIPNHKHLPSGIYKQKPNQIFSINAEPEYITIDDNDHYAYITLQENNGVAILDIYRLQIEGIFSFGFHDFGFSGLDASDRDNGINIKAYPNLYGLRQPDGISYYKTKDGGKQYILTANEGNSKYYDVLRVKEVGLDSEAFPDGNTLKEDENLGRLQILNGGTEYGDDGSGTFDKLYTFGSRDFTIWEIESSKNVNCPCDYPYGLKLVFSSYDDFEHITASDLGFNGFNSDLYAPSPDKRSDDKGPEPESITVGECSNGDVFAFIGLERTGGIMVYDITGIDVGNVYFVEYLNTRDFTVKYDRDTRPPENAGDVEPETLIFIPDTATSPGDALLIVGYKTSASIGIYSFDCGQHTDYTTEPNQHSTEDTPRTVDECIDQAPCLDIDIRPIIIEESVNSINIIRSDGGGSNSHSVSDYNSDSGSDSNNDGNSDSSDSMGRSPSNSDSDSGSDSNNDGDSDSSDIIDVSHSMDPSDSDSDSNNDGNSDSSDEEESNYTMKEIYIVCISFDIKNPYCMKEDIYFTYGVSLEDEEKQDAAALMPWYQGNKRCKVVECSSFARFAVRDGEGCGNSKALATSIDTVDYITCQQTERGSCRWKIPTPICRASMGNNNGAGSNGQNQGNNGDIVTVTTTTTTTTTIAPTVTTSADTTESGGNYFGDYNWKPDNDIFKKPEKVEKSDYASGCNEQKSCLKIEINGYDRNGEDEYVICMYWDSNTNECNKKKDVPFFKSATGTHEEDVVYRWKSGEKNKICKIVSCSDYGAFGIKDGSCADSEFDGNLDKIDGVSCSASDGGYGINDSCKWTIPAPQCEDIKNKYSNNRNTDDGDYQNQGDNDKKESRSTFDTITNKGGHFYESTMFYILLGMCILTCFCIIGCVVKHSRKRNGDTVIDDDDDDNDDNDVDGDGIGGDGFDDGFNDGFNDEFNGIDGDDEEHGIDTLQFQE